MKKIKLLVVDDSALIRKVLTDEINKSSTIEVVGSACDPYQARDMIVNLKPDVMTLDVEMPRMDGVEFLKRLMPQYPIPVVMVSSLTQKGASITLEALESGAIDYVIKPKSDVKNGLQHLIKEIISKVTIASTVDVSHWKLKRRELFEKFDSIRPTNIKTTDKIIAIGASTGGTEAIRMIVEMLPYNCPGVIIVQHMPSQFTKAFAERLNRNSRLEVKEVEDGDRLYPGRVLIAQGGRHSSVYRNGGEYRVRVFESEKVNGHAPSVSVLFESVSREVGKNAVGVILTGMGADGSKETLLMKNAGAYTIAQDENTSVIFGMPKEAIACGGINEVLPICEIAQRIMAIVEES